MNATGCLSSRILAHLTGSLFRKPFAAALPLFPNDATQASSNPRVQIGKYQRRLAEAEVASPSNQTTRQLFDHAFKDHTAPSTGEFPDTLLEPLYSPRGKTSFDGLALHEAKTREPAPLWAILDRLLPRAELITITGRSHRLRNKSEQGDPTPKRAATKKLEEKTP